MMEIVNAEWEQYHKDIVISIIIPSYNKYPLNLVTLYTLARQSFDMDKMEVLFIDDASTDETYKIAEQYHPPYPFRYIRLDKNAGRSKVRNTGIDLARGSLIIFLDAEVMVDEDFVLNHWQAHENEDRLVLTGGFHLKKVFTCIFPNFTPYQNTIFAERMFHNKLLYDRYLNYIKVEGSTKPYCLLFNKNEIDNQLYKKYTMTHSDYFYRIGKVYGEDLKGFKFPWMSFLTGDISLKKELLQEAGGFDENFVLYGYEDWELGYRLHKLNARFLAKKNVMGYHQEHPVSEENWREAMNNYYMFVKKHPDPDIAVMGLEISRIASLYRTNQILLEYHELLENYPHDYSALKEGFKKILDTIVILLRYDIRHKQLLDASGVQQSEIDKIRADLHQMKSNKCCRTLVHLFERKFFKGRA